jgi:hypothetical protein
MSIKLTAVVILILASCNAGEPTTQRPLFSSGPVIKLANKPSNVALADLNKDGRLDLVVASEQARTITIMPGFHSEAARTITIPEIPGEMVLGDVNSDNHLDLPTANGERGAIVKPPRPSRHCRNSFRYRTCKSATTGIESSADVVVGGWTGWL